MRYPLEITLAPRLTRESVEEGYDILYGGNSNLSLCDAFGYDWSNDIIVTAAYLYSTTPNLILLGVVL